MIKKLIGMEIERYSGEVCIGEYSYEDRELKRYRLVFGDGESLVLWETSGMCYSGWTTASWGNWQWSHKRMPFSYALKPGPIDVEIEEEKDIGITVTSIQDGCIIAEVEKDGDDPWYPEGFVSIDEGFFTSTRRTLSERPVWIFEGSSGLGKSSLAAMSGEKVFETDSVKKLPEQIWADIVVIGNKREFSIETIKQRLPRGTRPIVVHFSE